MATTATRRVFALGAFAATLGTGYLLMKLTVPSKESLMEVRYDVDIRVSRCGRRYSAAHIYIMMKDGLFLFYVQGLMRDYIITL